MELRKISDLFKLTSPNLFAFSIILGIVTGLSFSLLVPLIIYAVNTETWQKDGINIENFTFFDSPTAELAKIYILTCLVIIILRTITNLISKYIALYASMKHRLSIYSSIQRLSIEKLEQIGSSKIINYINIDIPAISNAAALLPSLIINIVIILGILSYLVYLDFQVFFFVLSALVIATITYQIPMSLAKIYYQKYREKFDILQEGVKGLVLAASELKLNKAKAKEFFKDELLNPEKEAIKYVMKGNAIFVFARSYGDMISFIVIGIVVFHLPYVFDVEREETFGIVMALLYLSGPVGVILSLFDTISLGKVSIKKIQELYIELSDLEQLNESDVHQDYQTISVNQLIYTYQSTDDSTKFSIGPINCSFKRGSITYIVGGNGSGKTTLARCLSLHYIPGSGSIEFGKQKISNENIKNAREHVSAIYSNFYLFKKLYGNNKLFQQKLFDKYLTYLGLEGKVSILGGVINTDALSDGQKKRLALLVLLLEDRDICVFDEWAADQDPHFKEVFYTRILPDLKVQNKTIIVISHDDRYFKFADYLIYMEDGAVNKIVEQNENSK